MFTNRRNNGFLVFKVFALLSIVFLGTNYSLINAAQEKVVIASFLSKSASYHIRKATMDDEQPLKKLYRRVAGIPGGLARSQDEMTDAYLHKTLFEGIHNGLALLVVADDDTLIGSMILYRFEPKIFSHVLGNGSILVDPGYQGKGIGSSLISTFLQIIQDEYPEILRIEITTRESNPALKLYEKLGFKKEGFFERKVQNIYGKLEGNIPLVWINPYFKYEKVKVKRLLRFAF